MADTLYACERCGQVNSDEPEECPVCGWDAYEEV